MSVSSSVALSEMLNEDRFDAEYFTPQHLAEANALRAFGAESLGTGCEVSNGRTPFEYTDDGESWVVRSGDLVRPLVSRAYGQAFLRTCRSVNAVNLRRGDVLISSIGAGSIGKIGLVTDAADLTTVSEVTIVRSTRYTPEYLFAYLASGIGQNQINRQVSGATGQQHLIKSRAEMILVPPPPSKAVLQNLTERIAAAGSKQQEARERLLSAEARLMEALGLDRLDLSPQKCYTRRFRDLDAASRFGAEYFMPCKTRILAALAKMPHKTVEAHANGIRDMYDPTRARKGEMVRNFDITDALEPFLDDSREPEEAIEMGSNKKRFQAGDVVVSRLRSYLKEIAVVRTSGTPQSVGSSEYIVLRPTGKGLSPETLMVYLRCPLVQTILKWSQDGSNHPRFTEEDLLAIPVPDKVLGVQKQIDGLVNRAIEARIEAARLLEQAKKTVENLIAGKP